MKTIFYHIVLNRLFPILTTFKARLYHKHIDKDAILLLVANIFFPDYIKRLIAYNMNYSDQIYSDNAHQKKNDSE